jgi:hypothetical protein
MREIVVNRLYPPGLCSVCESEGAAQTIALRRFARAFPRYGLWGVPVYPDKVRDRDTLESFWNSAVILYQSSRAQEEAEKNYVGQRA